MTDIARHDISEEQFLALVADLCAAAGDLTPLGAGVVLASYLGIASDSRTFSRLFGLAHALVLREVTALADERGLIDIVERNARTQRTMFALTDRARAVLSQAGLTSLSAQAEAA